MVLNYNNFIGSKSTRERFAEEKIYVEKLITSKRNGGQYRDR